MGTTFSQSAGENPCGCPPHLTYYPKTIYIDGTSRTSPILSNPTVYAIQTTASRITALRNAFGHRGLALLVMVAILLQAIVSPGLRLAVRAHFHLNSALAQQSDQDDEHGHAPTETDGGTNRQSNHHHHPHSHTNLASHEHSSASTDVVYIDTQNSEPPSNPASNRVALELDGLLLHNVPPSIDAPAQPVFTELALRFRSRVEPPLERPPRVVI